MIKQARRWIGAAAVTLAAATIAGASGTADLRCNELLTALRDGNYANATAHFDQRMKTALGPDKLEATWQQLTTANGKLVSWEANPPTDIGIGEVVVARLKFEHSSDFIAQVAVSRETAEISGLYFLVSPATPVSSTTSTPRTDSVKFSSENVKVGSPPFELPGILTIPSRKGGPFPAVVLLGGSGPVDKDEDVLANHPFKDIAEGLSAQGIVVLRYDKRTRVYGQKIDVRKFTIKEEYLDDAVAAVNLLRSRREVAKDHVFMAGHSLGATIAPDAALKAGPIQGLILLAPGGRKLSRMIIEQMRFLDEASPDQLAELERRANQLDNHQLAPTENFMFAPASYFYDLDARDEVAIARQLGVPILILHGGRDYQVIDEDIAHWQRGLKDVAHVHVETFPALNHLFIAGTGKPNKQEYSTLGHVDEKVISAMTDFIQNPLSN